MSMSDLAVLIQDTSAEIAKTQEFLATDSSDFYALMELETLEQRLATLQSRFNEFAAVERVQVLRYRLLIERASPSVKTVNDLLSTFQQAFTVLHDSIKTNTTKRRARVSEASAHSSAFGFAYSFSGSLGFALTLPADLSLLDNEFSRTLLAVERILSARDQADIKEFAGRFGLGAIRTVYRWIDAIVKSGFDAELEWHPDGERIEQFLVQIPDAQAVRNLILQTSEVEILEREYRGTLVAYDSIRRTFRFSAGNVAMMHGTVTDSLTEQLTVPAPYSVRVRVSTISRYSSEEKEESFELLALI